MQRAPSKATIKRVVEYLESKGLFVYGPCVDLDTGEQYGAYMDYGVEHVYKFVKLVDADKLWYAEQP